MLTAGRARAGHWWQQNIRQFTAAQTPPVTCWKSLTFAFGAKVCGRLTQQQVGCSTAHREADACWRSCSSTTVQACAAAGRNLCAQQQSAPPATPPILPLPVAVARRGVGPAPHACTAARPAARHAGVQSSRCASSKCATAGQYGPLLLEPRRWEHQGMPASTCHYQGVLCSAHNSPWCLCMAWSCSSRPMAQLC